MGGKAKSIKPLHKKNEERPKKKKGPKKRKEKKEKKKKGQYDACHMNGTVESCMAIYLGMAMEMP